MTIYQFCTTEWLEEIAQRYNETSHIKKNLKRFTAKICFRVKSNVDWGIIEDITFGAFMEKGELKELNFFTEDNAFKNAKYILAASLGAWKKVFTKERELLTYLMLDRIKIELGTKSSMIDLASRFDVVNIFTLVDLQFPDEMSESEIISYRSKIKNIRFERGP